MKTRRKKWSEEEKTILTNMYRQNMNASLIAEKLGRSRHSVYCKIDDLGLATPSMSSGRTRPTSTTRTTFNQHMASITMLEQALNKFSKQS